MWEDVHNFNESVNREVPVEGEEVIHCQSGSVVWIHFRFILLLTISKQWIFVNSLSVFYLRELGYWRLYSRDTDSGITSSHVGSFILKYSWTRTSAFIVLIFGQSSKMNNISARWYWSRAISSVLEVICAALLYSISEVFPASLMNFVE